MTPLRDGQTTTQVSGTSIVLGALIGVGFCIALGASGGAIAMSLGPDALELPSGGALVLVVLSIIALLAFAFFVAGFIASKMSHQQFRFDSILHSLGTWATMSMLLVMLVAVASTLESVGGALRAIKVPIIVTNLSLLSGKATTTLTPGSTEPEAPTTRDVNADYVLLIAWWIACLSLCAGAGTSIVGGLVGRRKVFTATP